MTQKKNNKGFLVYILIAGSIILALAYLINQSPNKTKEIDYGTFMGYFDNLQVEKYDLDLGTGKIKIKLKGKDEETTYKVPSVVLFKDELLMIIIIIVRNIIKQIQATHYNIMRNQFRIKALY